MTIFQSKTQKQLEALTAERDALASKLKALTSEQRKAELETIVKASTPVAATTSNVVAPTNRQAIVDRFIREQTKAEAAFNDEVKAIYDAKQKHKTETLEQKKRRVTQIVEKAMSGKSVDAEEQKLLNDPPRNSNPYDNRDSIEEIKREKLDKLLFKLVRVSNATVYNISGQYFLAVDTGRAYISRDGSKFVGLIKQFGSGRSTPGSTLAVTLNYYTDANGQRFAANESWREILARGGQCALDANGFPTNPVAVPDLTGAEVADLIKNTPSYSLVQQAYRFLENTTVTFDALKNGVVVW